MTYTIELDATEERVLAQVAAARGVDAVDYLRDAWREVAALDAQEDAEDLADARRVRATSDPTKRHTLAELRDALKGNRNE
jgi:predicted metal-dependent hydrolase